MSDASSDARPRPRVGIVMGSDSDWPRMKGAAEILTEFGVGFEVRIISAHRTPETAAQYASSAAQRGLDVLIAGAGGAAHLAGVLAAHTPLPIVGVPINATALAGLDALLATVQMPSGVPVASVAVDGARNAALLAVQILGVADGDLRERMLQYKARMRDRVIERDAQIQGQLQ